MGKVLFTSSVIVLFLMSITFAYFGSKSLTPYYYWIQEGINGYNNNNNNNNNHMEMQVVKCNNGGKMEKSSMEDKKMMMMKRSDECNWFEGRWVYDESYPMYDSMSCPFIRKEFNCIKYGRTNHEYLKYRWQPYGCDLPRFDGKDFFNKMKGKKIMYIGDSLSLNNFDSLLCLLHGTVPGVKYKEEFTHLNVTVTFLEYDVQVILFHSNFLVDIEKEEMGRVLKMNSMKDGEIWKQMHVLIFNNWLWWIRVPPKQPWDFIERDDGKVVKDMNRVDAFKMALKSWAKWVDREIDTTKTRVFFQGESAAHYHGPTWGKSATTTCQDEFIPINETLISTAPSPVTKISKNILSSISKPVFMLDFATLSRFRVDGHVSRYNPMKGRDCLHWCLAGVPDTWNLILYAALLQDS